MSPPEAARALAQAVMAQLALQPCCRMALCGGPVLPPLLAALNGLPAFQRIDWPHVHVFAADGRWDESAMAVLRQLPTPRCNLVRPRTAGMARLDAARDYEQTLRAHFSLAGGAIPAFDLMVLDAAAPGAGPGTGAAPSARGTPALEVGRLVLAQADGLSLSPAVVAAARLRLQVAA